MRTRWTLRCSDLLMRDAYIITMVDRAAGGLLLHLTGTRPVRLTIEDAQRLREQLREGIDAADHASGSSSSSAS